ncbi:MAG: TerB family tellurite resistance protein [Bacteroidetes bacterium]|nr:TerB family tellurite resistance protein [Bacteroidota bacterium]
MNQIHNDDSELSAKMALCLAAMTLAGIDGEFKEEELEKLRSFVSSDEASFLRAFSFYNEHSLDVCMKVVTARLNTEQRQITYRVLYDLAHLDKELAKSEEDLLKQYAAAFELDKNFLSWVKVNKDKRMSDLF